MNRRCFGHDAQGLTLVRAATEGLRHGWRLKSCVPYRRRRLTRRSSAKSALVGCHACVHCCVARSHGCVASRIGQRLIHGYHLPGSAPRPGEGGVSNRGRHSDTRRAAPSLHIYSSEEYSSIHHTRRTHMRTHIASWRFLGPLAPRYCVKLYRVVRSQTPLCLTAVAAAQL